MRTVAGLGVVVVAAAPPGVERGSARRPIALQAICWARGLRARWRRATSERTRSGKVMPHSSTCMPPIEPPSTAASARSPRWSARRAWARTMSRIVTTGKVEPYGRPVAGSDRRRTRRALAAAEHVGAHDEVAVGVDRPARADHALPPARRGMAAVRSARRRGCHRSRRGRRERRWRPWRRARPRSRRRCRRRAAARRLRARTDGRRRSRGTGDGRLVAGTPGAADRRRPPSIIVLLPRGRSGRSPAPTRRKPSLPDPPARDPTTSPPRPGCPDLREAPWGFRPRLPDRRTAARTVGHS